MIRIARKQAARSVFKRARVGAVIAKGDRILSVGHNAIRYSKYVHSKFPESVHAEQAAIAKLLQERRLHDLAGATIYVCRINSSGVHRLSRPCVCCADLIRSVGIREVVYTTNGGTSSYRV